MHTMRHPLVPTRRRGVVLLISVTLLLLSAIVALLLMQTLMDRGQLETHRRELTRAFYAAEAGVHEVVDWFNHPDDYSPNTSLFVPDADGNYTNLSSAIASGSHSVPDALLPSFSDNGSKHLADVQSIEIFQSTVPGSICRVRSHGVSFRGVDRTVEMDLYQLDASNGAAPAALITRGNIVSGGNVSVHWGEVWSLGSLDVPAQNKVDDMIEEEDPDGNGLVNFRSVGQLLFDTTWKEKGKMDWYNDNPTAIQPCLNMTQGDNADTYGPHFFQYEPDLESRFPNYPYEAYKDIALHRGGYYSTDADGNIYRDGIETAENIIDWNTEFNTSADSGGEWRLIFIDTIDGNAPNGDASTPTTNLSEISISGSVPHTRGVFYINANVNITGTGNPPDLTVDDPTVLGGDYTIDKVMHHGLWIVNGKMTNAGNMVVFGSVYVDGYFEQDKKTGAISRVGFAGTGTPTIYYDPDLADGTPDPLTSRVVARLWKVY